MDAFEGLSGVGGEVALQQPTSQEEKDRNEVKMDEDEDDYEKIRLENMRANAELMESLGLGVSVWPRL